MNIINIYVFNNIGLNFLKKEVIIKQRIIIRI